MDRASAPTDRDAIAGELGMLGVTAHPDGIELEELTHNRANQVTAGVWIVRSAGFEAVLKLVVDRPTGDPRWPPSTVPTEWNYWRREAEAYRTGFTEVFASCGIHGPRRLQVVRRTGAAEAIWMQRVPGRSGHEIGEDDITELSFRLGQAQGAWSAGPENVVPPWASRRFLRKYAGSKGVRWELLDDDTAWTQPVVAGSFPAGLRAAASRLHRERDWFFAVMEQLPRTLAHLDVWPNNMIVTDASDQVLVDWAFLGDGALGEDIGNLVPDAVFDRFVAADRMPALGDRSLDRYLDGLGRGGWSGDDRHVALGFHASAVKYVWLVPWLLERAGDEQFDYGGDVRVDPVERYREHGRALLVLMDWAERARQLVRRHPALVAPELQAGRRT